MTALDDELGTVPAGPADPGRDRSSRLRREGGWLAAALGTVGVVWVLILLLDKRHFFSGDSEQAYYGWWYTVGEALRHGQLALLDPHQLAWGNHAVEGQLGLYNPLIAVIGLGATVAPWLVAYATLVKFLVAALGVVGCYGLVRSYRVAPPLAAAAAVAVALCGYTYELSSARWFDGQLGLALLPWAWWTTRRLVHGRSPFPALACCGLVITIGYVYPTLYLGAVLLVCLVEALLLRGRRAVLAGVGKLVLVGAFCAMVATLVYLPGMKSAGMTVRAGDEIVWDGPNRLEWWQIPLLWQPVGKTEPPIFKFSSWSPVEYVVWWLPLLLLVEVRLVTERWRELLPLLVGALVWVLWSLGPATVGPLRWPGRSLEALTLMVSVFVIVAVAHCAPRGATRMRLGLLAAFVAVSELLVILWHHHQLWPRLGSGLALLIGLVAAGCWLGRRPRLGALLLVGSLAFGVVAATVPQTEEPTLSLPGDKAAYAHVISHTRGSIIQINASDEPRYTKERGRHLLRGSLWALTDKPVMNGYTTAQPRAFRERFKSHYMGGLPPEALAELMQPQAPTGQPLATLFGISTIILERGYPWGSPPPGWHVATQTKVSITWVRDRPVALAGGVSWCSPGTSVRTLAEGPLGVTFRVADVPDTGGSVVLSRLAWPGYRVAGAGARLAAPVGDLLVRVRVSAGAAGRDITVSFRPPGWHLEMGCAGGAAVLTLLWSGLWLWRRRRVASGQPGAGRFPG